MCSLARHRHRYPVSRRLVSERVPEVDQRRDKREPNASSPEGTFKHWPRGSDKGDYVAFGRAEKVWELVYDNWRM